ncbi:MAG: ABC-2 transporter permease [Methanomicrobiaceae archaeon]|nr:ABC-2 transporter permease [Methanomicrobiaceae archaeon]
MSGVLTVARKEIRQVLGTKGSLIAAIFFAIWFGGLSAPALAAGGNSLDMSVFYLGLVLGVFISYLLSGQVFLREKQEGIIETLLCTPLGIREIWLGKVIGVVIPAYCISLFGVAVLTGIANHLSGELLLPSAPVAIHLVAGVPLVMASAVGIIGFIQFLFGMREIAIINLVIFAGLFFLLFMMQAVLESGLGVSWAEVGFILVAGVLLLAGTDRLARRLDKEKIVRTIP